MALINMSRFVTPPKGKMGFTINRKSAGQFVEGGFSETTSQIVVTDGSAVPTSSKDIQQLPEADRIAQSMTFYCKEAMFVTRSNAGTSDQILYGGSLWRLERVYDRSEFGFFKAVGLRMAGD
jgi:hypothetical protein